MTLRFAFFWAMGLATLWAISASAQSADDRRALNGLNEIKIIFDITSGDAERLTGTLAVIEETRASLIKQGVVPEIVLAFRGGATKLVQTDLNALTPEQRKHSSEIAAAIRAFGSAKGIASMEQCGIAAKNNGVGSDKLLPGISLVGNGWVSLAAYQAKGLVTSLHERILSSRRRGHRILGLRSGADDALRNSVCGIRGCAGEARLSSGRC